MPLGCPRTLGYSVSYSRFPLAVYFTHGDAHVSTLLSPLAPPSPSPAVSTVCSLCLRFYSCPANRFLNTIFLDFMLVYSIHFPLPDLLHILYNRAAPPTSSSFQSHGPDSNQGETKFLSSFETWPLCKSPSLSPLVRKFRLHISIHFITLQKPREPSKDWTEESLGMESSKQIWRQNPQFNFQFCSLLTIRL